MTWNISYVSTVEPWLNSLTVHQLKSVAKEIRLLELSGHKLRLPHSRSLGNGLFELRERKFGYRIYYTFDNDKVIILLHAGDKSSQKKDIERAREALKNYRGGWYED
ncbi:type II toxin-antitoxin system RelE/ParE family toxin [Thiotrichales bacterium 19S9-12]|nr:type II toxin-antitoxin system RelE/ParE family toxin [Thiotrichales bacterium 19S9-11]MCF6811889.1 type II toxin-antitoxin system RelE/ParE family toxin [Thiotrichales bacterium 19S9-12]